MWIPSQNTHQLKSDNTGYIIRGKWHSYGSDAVPDENSTKVHLGKKEYFKKQKQTFSFQQYIYKDY